jgi:hypothetical protein
MEVQGIRCPSVECESPVPAFGALLFRVRAAYLGHIGTIVIERYWAENPGHVVTAILGLGELKPN